MFWLLKKIFSLGVLVAIVFFLMQFRIGGRQVKDYVNDFYHSAIVQEAIRQTTEAVKGYLQKDVGSRAHSGEGDTVMDPVSEEDQNELDKVLQKESRKSAP